MGTKVKGLRMLPWMEHVAGREGFIRHEGEDVDDERPVCCVVVDLAATHEGPDVRVRTVAADDE
ncbi:hypothetical protein SANTM175S_01690 [Streptomyces antimycoticus]